MTEGQPRVPRRILLDYCVAAAAYGGLPTADRTIFATALVEADMRGIPTHGSYRLPQYVRAFRAGDVNPTPTVRVVSSRLASELQDGDNGSGLVLGQRAMQRAVELARAAGIGAVATRASNHVGMLAQHVMVAADAGLIGYFVGDAPALMAPHGGRDSLLGNGPFAYAVPTSGEPLIADMACSFVARGKIRMAAEREESIPTGWALDATGRATNSAAEAMSGPLLAMAGHKGYSLAVINEVLSSCLPGAVPAFEMSRQFLRPGARAYDSWGAGHLAIAIDPEAFGPLGEFEASVEKLIGTLRASSPAAGFDAVLAPGDPELRTHRVAEEEGIALAAGTVAALDEFAAESGLATPW
jgi:LDH2 family malate/lactate/ureidoglycolate dehydrogenase